MTKTNNHFVSMSTSALLAFRHFLNTVAPLSQTDWEIIGAHCQVNSYQKGEYLLRHGKVCDALGFVVAGAFRTFVPSESGEEISTHFAFDASFAVSFYSFIRQQISFESIVALEDSQVVRISVESHRQLLQQVPAWNVLYRTGMEESYACLEKRNYILQSLPSSERFRLLVEQDHPKLLQLVPQRHIASYLGIKEETLSRLRRKLHPSFS